MASGSFVRVFDWVTRIGTLVLLASTVALYSEQRDTTAHLRQVTDCQAKINEAQSKRALNLDEDVTRERVKERVADEAMTVLVEGLLQRPPATQAVIRQRFIALGEALEDQRMARIEADKSRAQNPPVPPGNQVCR